MESELAVVAPIIEAARLAVGQIKSDHLNEIRSLKAPPDAIRDVLEGVLKLMGQADTSWNSMKKFLGNRGVKVVLAKVPLAVWTYEGLEHCCAALCDSPAICLNFGLLVFSSLVWQYAMPALYTEAPQVAKPSAQQAEQRCTWLGPNPEWHTFSVACKRTDWMPATCHMYTTVLAAVRHSAIMQFFHCNSPSVWFAERDH